MSLPANIVQSESQAKADHVTKITLNPGDFRFAQSTSGKAPIRLYTLLGSCVSVILWHPGLKYGGMSHSLLPTRTSQAVNKMNDGRYCVEAIALFRQELARSNTSALQYHVYIVGGANMFGQSKGQPLIGDRNVELTRLTLIKAGFQVRAEHVLGDKYRKVELDMHSGEVRVTINQKLVRL
jgi:chemotaxis protein CheD